MWFGICIKINLIWLVNNFLVGQIMTWKFTIDIKILFFWVEHALLCQCAFDMIFFLTPRLKEYIFDRIMLFSVRKFRFFCQLRMIRIWNPNFSKYIFLSVQTRQKTIFLSITRQAILNTLSSQPCRYFPVRLPTKTIFLWVF